MLNKKKVIWITATPIYSPQSTLSNNVREGWIRGALNGVLEYQKEIQIINLYPVNGSECTEFKDSGIWYSTFWSNINATCLQQKTVDIFIDLFAMYMPNIIHIWGTERTYCLAAVKAAMELNMIDKVVISMQGSMFFWAQKFYKEIPWVYRLGCSLPEIRHLTSLYRQKKEFEKRAKCEIEAIKMVSNLIGRTEWDKTSMRQINPDARIFHCDEILRQQFYGGEKWKIEKCERFSIFICQGLTPYKSLHQLIKAMPYILREFPETKVYCTGKMGFNKYNIPIKKSYERYLSKMMKRYNLSDKIIFLGQLSPEKMKRQFLNSNVYVCPSAMENESNSLSEAKILGVPSVISYVGGMIDRVEHGVDGFVYPFDEPNMLAEYVCKIFRDVELTTRMSNKAIERASWTNDLERNAKALQDIYRTILDV